MMRAMRVDKMTLAGLAATLRLYRNIDEAEEKVPLLANVVKRRWIAFAVELERMLPRLQALAYFQSVEIVEAQSMLGGGIHPNSKCADDLFAGQTSIDFRSTAFGSKFAKVSPRFSAASRMTLIILTFERFCLARI